MGLTIYYKGRFNPKASLSEMIDEVCDISDIYKWKCHVFETKFPKGSLGKTGFNENIYGLVVSPHEKSEGVWLCFLSNGTLGNPVMLEHWLKTKNKKDKRLIYGNFTKTQYAGPDVHKVVIDLLRYLSKKYFREFHLEDEAMYWETGNEKLMRQTFEEWGALMNSFAVSLQAIKPKKMESLERVIKRAAEKVHAKRKK